MPSKIQNELKIDDNPFGRPQTLEQINGLLEIPVTMPEIEEKLKATQPYYLDRNGLTVDSNGKLINYSSRIYLWGMLEGWKKKNSNKQLYVWKTLSKDGKFRNMRFGTREAFDTEVAKRLNDNKTK